MSQIFECIADPGQQSSCRFAPKKELFNRESLVFRQTDLSQTASMYSMKKLRRLMVLQLVGIAVAMTGISAAFSDEGQVKREELPKLVDMQLPTADELLRADEEDKEFDWIVMISPQPENRRVLVVNPVDPRPDTLKKMAAEAAKVEASKPTTPEERDARARRLQQLKKLEITLPGDLKAYNWPIDQIDDIIYFDDLMLLRVDELLKVGEIRKAYELLLRVENEIPNWEKSVPRFEQLMLVESSQRAEAGDTYAALALLDEVARRNINNPELSIRFGSIVTPMISDSIAQEDFRKARYLISRIARVFPEHATVKESTERMQQIVSDLMSQAAADYSKRDFRNAAELARKADTVWQLTGNQRAAFTQYFARHQTLRVGVEDIDGMKQVFPAPQESLERLSELVEVPLYEPYSADELTYFRSSYFEIWDPTDLGREVLFSLRETRPHWQSQPVLTANDVAESLGHRIDHNSPYFSPRLASFVKEISVRSPSELRIRFSRVPLSIESLLRFPVIGRPSRASSSDAAESAADPVAETSEISEGSAGSVSPVVLSTRFKLVQSDESGRRFVRQRPEPDGLDSGLYHVAEISEQRYTDREKMLQALIRGELDFLPHLRPWEVDAFQSSSDFNTLPYALPITHVIAFNPVSERIVNAQMRRALSFAINRERILKSVILRDEGMKHGRPTSAAWHLQSYATDPNQAPPPYNLRLAFALRFAAERQLQIAELTRLLDAAKAEAKKNKTEIDPEKFREETKVDYIKLPGLRLVVDPDPSCIAAAERMMTYWKTIGFEIELIRGDQPGETLTDADWDMCYRRVRMEEPLLELWPLLASDSSLNMERLRMFPDWMRQELINLDYASSFKDAQSRLSTIHSHIADEAFLIPLWEVDEFAVARKSVIGTPDRPMSTYQNVERWILRP